MAKLRVRVPVEIEVTPETAQAVGALGEVITAARASGLPEALGKLVSSTRDAVRSHRRRRSRPAR